MFWYVLQCHFYLSAGQSADFYRLRERAAVSVRDDVTFKIGVDELLERLGPA